MTAVISPALRRRIAQQAGRRCEYCLLPEAVRCTAMSLITSSPCNMAALQTPPTSLWPACGQPLQGAERWLL